MNRRTELYIGAAEAGSRLQSILGALGNPDAPILEASITQNLGMLSSIQIIANIETIEKVDRFQEEFGKGMLRLGLQRLRCEVESQRLKALTATFDEGLAAEAPKDWQATHQKASAVDDERRDHALSKLMLLKASTESSLALSSFAAEAVIAIREELEVQPLIEIRYLRGKAEGVTRMQAEVDQYFDELKNGG